MEGARQSAAAAAAEQVKAIVAAAEQSAAALEAAALEDAERIRADAERDAAGSRAAAERLGGRADELERRLGELLAGVRSAVEALRADLETLRGAAADEGEVPETVVDEELIAEVEAVAAPEPDVKAEQEGAPEGARVLALKMALDGSPREDTARYLSENFELDDAEGLLDEVYAKAGR